MSRIGKKPIQLPNNIGVQRSDRQVSITGPNGSIKVELHGRIDVELGPTAMTVVFDLENKEAKAIGGLYRSLLQNAVTGVSAGFEKKLELSGVGYQCAVKGKVVELAVGYSKPVVLDIPEGVKCVAPDSTHLTVRGADRQLVGQFAAQLRACRVPDPYKAKGVKYQGEVVKRKAGKAFGSGG